MPSLKRLPGEPIRCRAIVPVPGKVHTVRCKERALHYGLCDHHWRVHVLRPEGEPEIVLYAGILADSA